jgi:hypothetical protein
MAKGSNNSAIKLTVLVNGDPVKANVKGDDLLSQVLAEALTKSQNVAQPAENWEVRTEQGALLDQAQTIRSLALVDGTVVVATIKTGAAG